MKIIDKSMKWLAVLPCSLAIVLCSSVIANAQSLTTDSWKSTPPNVASESWTPSQISSFLDSITPTRVPANVGDFRFVDLGADGNLELLAAVDYSGRGSFNGIVVVHKTSSGFGVQDIEASNVTSLSGLVLDIKGDGKKELLVPKSLTGYTSAGFPADSWLAVYTWVQQVMTDATAQFSGYERSLLPGLQQAAANLSKSAPGSVSATAAQAVYDKVLRVSGVDPAAGLADASGWAASAEAEIRTIAAATLADIGTPAATTVLAPLLADANATVGIYARLGVSRALDAKAAQLFINIQPQHSNTVHVSSHGPILVRILKRNGFTNPAGLNFRSIKFGQTGTESSLKECKRDDDGVNCTFSISASGLSPGDAVGILQGKLKAGGQARGIGPVSVIDGRVQHKGKDDDDHQDDDH